MTFKAFLSEWQLRGSFLISLLLQVLQFLPFNTRKRNPYMLLTGCLWILYLVTDKVAIYGISIASRTITDPTLKIHPQLLSFWTPILLLHLGGPDNITAFSLEDNQLWLRQILTLVSQILFAGYVLVRSWMNNSIRLLLLISSICVYIAGTLKYGERAWAFKRASTGSLRASMMSAGDPGPNYTDCVDRRLSSKLNAGIPEDIEESVNNLPIHPAEAGNDQPQVSNLYTAYNYYQAFKRLFVELILSYEDGKRSRLDFKKKNASEAFEMVGIELNFAYDALYTKALVAHTRAGCIIRATNMALVIAALLLFVVIDKKDFRDTDVLITYLLLVGALALEIGSLAVSLISDWTIVLLRSSYRDHQNLKGLEKPIFSILNWVRQPNKPRWSHSMKQHSLLRFCLHDQESWFAKRLANFNAKESFDKYWFTENKKVPGELENRIWESLLEKVPQEQDIHNFELADQYKSLNTCTASVFESCSELKWSTEGDFDKTLLLWHVATDICYNSQENQDENKDTSREASKLISRYLLYLLIVRPFTLSSTAVLGLIRYRDTCAELIQFFKEEEVVGHESPKDHKCCRSLYKVLCCRSGYCTAPDVERKSDACDNLLFMHTDVPPKKVKKDLSKSVLWDAVVLAKQLLELKHKMWKTMASVWIEMLCFVARNCRGDYHAKLLSEGGELLTCVWFLEAHLGLGDYFKMAIANTD
ncbi:uncharacterized protein LOC132296219 [Cornus florida]|uniref:uncharacterized protein LOC132296219 n=1 Tax=Cornus florida TaxID=4283 RepID=UPI00289D55E4|nr:uncharacterized protein LOC132296219 [Cornus florida]